MAQGKDSEQFSFSGLGATVSVSGLHAVIILCLLVTLGGILYITFRHVETSRQQMVEQMELSRQQYWLIYRELRIQTGIMSLPEWKRPELVDPDDLEKNLKRHLDETPQLQPKIFDGRPPPPKPPATPHMDP